MDELEYKHRLYWARKNSGLCVQCGKEDAYTMNGRARCAECSRKKTERAKKKYLENPEFKEEKLNYGREHRRKNKAAGLCISCGRPAEQGHVYCGRCLVRQRIYYHENYVFSAPPPDSVCRHCRKAPVVEGYKLCVDCLDHMRVIGARGSAVVLENRKRFVHPWVADNRIVFLNARKGARI